MDTSDLTLIGYRIEGNGLVVVDSHQNEHTVSNSDELAELLFALAEEKSDVDGAEVHHEEERPPSIAEALINGVEGHLREKHGDFAGAVFGTFARNPRVQKAATSGLSNLSGFRRTGRKRW